jgi:hypothetical protein
MPSSNVTLIKQLLVVFVLSFLLLSCSSSAQPNKSGVLQLVTHFYDTTGKITFTHYLKIWYKDSTAIENITGMHSDTDTSNITTVTYPLILCRYMDLRSKTLYDYRTFSDTSIMFNKALIPDTLMKDYGWSFYSDKALQIIEEPEPMSDTTIDNTHYKRAKFCFLHDDPKKQYQIGYFNCDNGISMFSQEKNYSRKINCNLVKFYDYHIGHEKPFGSQEIVQLADHLTPEELKVFDAWEMNAKN